MLCFSVDHFCHSVLCFSVNHSCHCVLCFSVNPLFSTNHCPQAISNCMGSSFFRLMENVKSTPATIIVCRLLGGGGGGGFRRYMLLQSHHVRSVRHVTGTMESQACFCPPPKHKIQESSYFPPGEKVKDST